MRKIFILSILFGISYALKAFEILSDTHDAVLLAIGLVILAAYTLSEIGSQIKLPQVTGYILAGLLLGPYALKILSSNVVQEIEMFNTLAIGLIATTAGLELHFPSLKKVILPILSTSVLKLITLVGFSIAVIFVANQYVYDFDMGMGLPLVALAVVFGVLSLGTSPAISIAVISEMKAKSRMSQMVLGSAIVKDVIVVVSLAVAMAFARSVSGEGSENIAASFIHLMEELGLSLLAGVILGIITIGYLKYIRQEMFFAITAMILATAEISKLVHLELLLVFIIAGIVVRNFSKDQEHLHDALEKVSLPVFVVFFTNVGAGLNLNTTWQFLPIAGLLFASRALSFIFSGWVSGKLHKESPSIRNKIWLGYIPQAGVTLGLIQIASRELSQHAEIITNIGIGLVTLNLLLGPVALRLVLKGEEPQTQEEGDEESPAIASNGNGKRAHSNKSVEERDFFELIDQQSLRIADSVLREQFLELSSKLYEIFRKSQVYPQKSILNNFVEELNHLNKHSEQEVVAKIDDHFRKMGEMGRDIYNTIAVLQKELDHLLVVEMRPYPRTAIELQKNDGPWVTIKKIMSRPYFVVNPNKQREVPVRKLAKYNIEPFIAAHSLSLINSWFRLLGRHINIFQKSLDGDEFNAEDIVSTIQKENEIWSKAAFSDFTHGYSYAAESMIKHFNTISTTYLSDRQIRYSQVEPQITERYEKAKKDSLIWEEKFIYCRNRLKVIVQSALLSSAVEKLLEEKFFVPVERAKKNADELVGDVYGFFEKIEKEIREDRDLGAELFKNLLVETDEFSKSHLQADIKTKYVRGSFRLLNRDISVNLRKSLPKEEGTFQIASEQTPAHQVNDPSEILIKKINLHELFEQSILINFLPVIEERIEGVSNYLESLLMEMEQAFSILHYNLESEVKGESQVDQKELADSLLTTLSTERDKIKELHEGLINFITSSNQSTEKLLEECQQEVRQGVERFSVVSTAKNQFRMQIAVGVKKLRAIKGDFEDWVKNSYRRFKKLGIQHTERDIDRALHKKMLAKTLDTTTVRQFIEDTYSLNHDMDHLPRVYFRLFSLDPIQDSRFFIAHKHKWKHFSSLSQGSSKGESQKILIIGDRGMGKSSLINVAQVEIQSPQLIRIEGDHKKGPVYALSRALGCSASSGVILNNLRQTETTVIIDNVDQVLNKDNLHQFEELFDIIKHSPHSAHWILSITRFNLDSLDRSFKIRSLFNKLIDLNPVHLDTAKELILGRHRLSGLNIEYPKTLVSDMAMKIGFSSEDEMFFRVLFERSQGHLRHLIYLWLLSLESCDGRNIHLSLNKIVERGLPMVNDFSLLQKYILNELYCYHELNLTELSKNLGVSYSLVDNETQYLEHCGLIKTKGVDRSVFEIPNPLVMPVGFELKKEGILNEGFSHFRN